MTRTPIIGIVCDRRPSRVHMYQRVGEKYIIAARDGADVVPVLIPALDPPLDPATVLARFDGLLLTGSASNVAPDHYGGHAARRPETLDEARDRTALPLIRAAVAAGVPVFCICRGFQELNVALGGTLHQHLEEIPGHRDHRERENDPLEVQYGPAHAVSIVPGGLLARLAPAREARVNSLHGQGIDRLAPPLRVEATAPDGVVEAASLKAPKGFLLGVQWHPEWKFADDPLSRAMFAAFGAAVRAYAEACLTKA